jgi:hypothetical protein
MEIPEEVVMLKRLKDHLQRLVRQPIPVDPSRFGDPHALRTEWTPLEAGGSSFRTHRLRQVDAGRAEFRAAPAARLFYGIFVLMGAGFPIGIIASQTFSSGLSAGPWMLFPVVGGAVFMAIGATLMYRATAPVVFDGARGLFWKGRTEPDQLGLPPQNNWARFGDIHALQLISEHVTGGESSYYSYELNLVLEDGRRIGVVDHGDREQLRKDAMILAQFLGKPVWDAVE